jgi:putative hemolysin
MLDHERKLALEFPRDIGVTKGDLTLRLARAPDEIEACQRLRYRVFYEELQAQPDNAARASRRDADRFDPICDHLVVVRRSRSDTSEPIQLADGELVGTYRLLRQEVARRHGGFYTEAEFDIRPLLDRHPHLKFLELGRSCVLAPYRTRPVVELLWQGIWNYVRVHGLDVMVGCASLEGTNQQDHALSLAFLAANARAPQAWRVSAKPGHHVPMQQPEAGAIDAKIALRALPPLIKGYLRLGCYIGDGAVVDRQFNTIDVLIILPVSAINRRYFTHFGRPND